MAVGTKEIRPAECMLVWYDVQFYLLAYVRVCIEMQYMVMNKSSPQSVTEQITFLYYRILSIKRVLNILIIN